jgi:hypothetical protein
MREMTPELAREYGLVSKEDTLFLQDGMTVEQAVVANRVITRCQRKWRDWDTIEVTMDGKDVSFADISVWPDLSNSRGQVVQFSPSHQPVFKVG